jgi:hypothetical protein
MLWLEANEKPGGATVQITIGWTCLILGALLYIAQLISSIDFKLAQQLGIQENPEETDSILQTAERYTAWWDLVTLGWLPLAGLLMILESPYWPVVGLVGGAIYFDTSGREAAKIISFRKEGVRLGTDQQQKLFMGSYVVMAMMGLALIGYSVHALI